LHFAAAFSWQNIQNGMVRGITNALPATIILIIVSILIGVWILGEYRSTDLLRPHGAIAIDFFLPVTVVICALTSLATKTS
jgi:NhaC family Na+:H+ antiporter